MEYYKHYLLGDHFRVGSDHEALKWLFSMKEPKHHIAWWIEVLSEFVFELEYCPGKKHRNVDALSRCSSPRDCSCPIAEEHELPCKSYKKCLRKAETMLGTLPDSVSQAFEVMRKTARTVQMNVQSGFRLGTLQIIPCSWKLLEEESCMLTISLPQWKC